MIAWILFAELIAFSFAAIAVADDKEDYLGNYRASLECPGGAIEFELQILRKLESGTQLHAKIVNGLEEAIAIEKVTIDDNGLLIDIDHFDSRIRAKKSVDSTQLEGIWEKRRGNEKWSRLKFNAVKIPPEQESKSYDAGGKHDLFAGKWLVKFATSADPAVAIFGSGKPRSSKGPREQLFLSSRTFSGTFLTTTGDYRYLAGDVDEEKRSATLSCFDGGHAFLFKMKLQEDGSLKGDFWSSDSWHETWTAVRDENAQLPDAFAQTKILKSNINDLSFADLDGKMTSIGDVKFAGKARLVYVFGSWCPNCHDAAAYFSHLQKVKFQNRDLSILGLAFELTDDQKRNVEQIKKYLARHGCEYPVLIAGPSDKELATKAFPVLDRVRSYPTTLFLDQAGNIKAIHTGFTGPATGKAFEDLKTKFESQIEALLEEK